jgi:hypothetical protein
MFTPREARSRKKFFNEMILAYYIYIQTIFILKYNMKYLLSVIYAYFVVVDFTAAYFQFQQTRILKIIGQCEVKHFRTLLIKTITSVFNVSTLITAIILVYLSFINEWFNLIWILQSDWMIRLEKILVILDNLGWYCDVTNVFSRQRQIQIVAWNNRN